MDPIYCKNYTEFSAPLLLSSSAYKQLGRCYPPRPTASTHNTVLDLLNSS